MTRGHKNIQHSTLNTWVRKLLLLTPILLSVLSASCRLYCQTETEEAQLTIKAGAGFGIQYDIEGRRFVAEPDVRITYKDAVLTADHVEGDASTGDIEAAGNVSFKDSTRSLNGPAFRYNFRTRVGIAKDTSAQANGVYFTGSELRSEPDRYSIAKSRFTTCEMDHPHYYLSARELSLVPGKEVVARGVSIYLLGKILFSLPKLRVDLSKPDRLGERLIPPISFSGSYGFFTDRRFDLSSGTGTTGALDMRLSTERGWQAGLMYDQIAGTPVFARITSRFPAYSGTETGVLVTRLPEIGYRYLSGDETPELSGRRRSLDILSGTSALEVHPKTPGKLNLAAEGGVGYFIEHPGNVSSPRADLRATAWLSPISLGSRASLSPGIFGRYSAYEAGDRYGAFGLRMTLLADLGLGVSGQLTYAMRTNWGSTPFEFDESELGSELSGSVRFPIMGLDIGFGGRYDLSTGKWFESEYFLARQLHCLKPNITYNTRYRELLIGMDLVGL